MAGLGVFFRALVISLENSTLAFDVDIENVPVIKTGNQFRKI